MSCFNQYNAIEFEFYFACTCNGVHVCFKTMFLEPLLTRVAMRTSVVLAVGHCACVYLSDTLVYRVEIS